MRTEEIQNLYLISSRRVAGLIDVNAHCLSNILRRRTASYMEIHISNKTKALYQKGVGF